MNSTPSPKTRFWVYAITAIISAGLLTYALTIAFVWDEGFHLVAAQLIERGKTPYLDFCFPQTPLNAYWNAAWLHLFGSSWRVPHIPAALEISATMFLTAQFLLSRFPVPRWRAPAAIVAVCFVGLNSVIVQFGPIAQAYAIGMLLTVAAFRVAVAQPNRARSALLSLGSGVLAGAAAACTLLTAPVTLVLFLWFGIRSQGLARFKNLVAFAFGVIVPFTPVIWLFAKAPRVVFFNVVEYQALFRRVNWPGATSHDVDVLSAWLADAQTLLLGLLALAGVYFLMRKSNWPATNRTQFYFAGSVAAALILYIATAHPTFARYFVFAIPFLSTLAVAGFYWVASSLGDANRPLLPTTFLVLILALGCSRGLFEDRDSTTWHDYEKIAEKVQQVTPKNGLIYADELVYFLLKISPPPGMEFSYSHKLELPPAEEKLYHVVSEKELAAEVKAGKFATVQSCNDDQISEMHLDQLFAKKEDIEDCTVYWDEIPAKPSLARK